MSNFDDDDAYIDVVCLSCFKDLRVPIQYAGTRGTCKHCGAKIDVPRGSGARRQALPEKTSPARSRDGVKENASGFLENFREKGQFLASIVAAAVIGGIWSVLLAKDDTGKSLFLLMSGLSAVLFAASVFFAFGRDYANRVYLKWGLNDDFCRNIPLDTLNIILVVLGLTHFIPVGPFLFNLLGFFRPEPGTHDLAFNFLCFGMFPLVAHSFLRRGNRLALGLTTLFFVVVFIGTYLYVSNTANLGDFKASYFVEIRGFAPFLYWALSGIIYIMAIAALYVCWRDADK